MDFRRYARAKQLYEEGLHEPDIKKRPSGPLLDKVEATSWELVKEKIEQRKRDKEKK